jgi:AraC family transcriptional regulator
MAEEKHILTGIERALPEKHVWRELSGYSLYAAEQPSTFWHEHSHSCTQITVALDPAYIRAEWRGLAGSAQNRELSGDCVSIIPPGVEHATFWNRRADLVNMYLDDEFFRQTARDSLGGTLPSLSPSFLVRDPFLVEMAKILRRESELGAMSELFIGSVSTVMAVHLFRTYGGKAGILPEYRGGLGPARERKVRAYIEEHLHMPLTLEGLAAVADVSPNYFVSLFRQSTGMTPHRYVLRQRVARAAELLAHLRLPLVDIAFRCGFLDQSQFTTTFRKFLGVTPGQYRKAL